MSEAHSEDEVEVEVKDEVKDEASDRGRRRRRRRSTSPSTSISTSTSPFLSSLTLSSTSIFLFTAVLGVFVAYSKAAAFDRFLLIGLGLFVAWVTAYLNGATRDEGMAGLVAVGSVWLAAALGLIFLLAVDGPDQVMAIPAAGRALAQIVRTWLPNQADGVAVNANVAASGLVVLIGLGAGGVAWLGRRQRALAALCLLPMTAATGALLLTTSRGAWLGLATGALTAVYLWKRTVAWRTARWRFLTDTGLALLLLGLVAGFLWAMARPDVAGPLGSGQVGSSALSRAYLWRDVLPLIEDYRFTGSGLAGSMPILSAYTYLLHVGFLTHAHNLYLQIALAQGIPGLIGFVGMVVAASMSLLLLLRNGDADQRPLAAGAVAALIGLLVHGLVDAALYTSLLVPLLFLPFGVTWALFGSLRRTEQAGRKRGHRPSRTPALIGVLAPVCLVLLLFLLPGSRAAFQTNLGAVSQTATELRVYRWPDWPIQDALRRGRASELAPAIQRYAAALQYNPMNATANRRIGQIAISLGDLDSAQLHLEAAYVKEAHAHATRQMLGEVYALQGRTDEAVQLWRAINTDAGQLQARQWWWKTYGTLDQNRNFMAAMAQLSANAQP